MIKIAICDDDEKELDKTKSMCNTYAAAHREFDMQICTFLSSGELMLHIEQQEQYDIMLLDIYMPEMTGIELARVLRERNDDCQIVFLTTSLTHAIEAFSLHASHYLVKPFTEEQFEVGLSKTIDALKKYKRAQLTLKTTSAVHKFHFVDFLYAETERHIQNIYLVDGRCLQVRITSNELYQLLSQDSRFFKCGSTYIINLEKVGEVTVRTILLENRVQLPMQRRQYKELIDRYTSYALEGN